MRNTKSIATPTEQRGESGAESAVPGAERHDQRQRRRRQWLPRQPAREEPPKPWPRARPGTVTAYAPNRRLPEVYLQSGLGAEKLGLYRNGEAEKRRKHWDG